MSGEDHLDLFRTAASQWLCDPYSVEIRYFALREDSFNKLISCSINFSPLANFPGIQLNVTTDKVIAGREFITNYPANKIKEFLHNLENGQLILNNKPFDLGLKQGLSHFSEMISSDRWVCDAHLIMVMLFSLFQV
jgi:hypothetical protein